MGNIFTGEKPHKGSIEEMDTILVQVTAEAISVTLLLLSLTSLQCSGSGVRGSGINISVMRGHVILSSHRECVVHEWSQPCQCNLCCSQSSEYFLLTSM